MEGEREEKAEESKREEGIKDRKKENKKLLRRIKHELSTEEINNRAAKVLNVHKWP